MKAWLRRLLTALGLAFLIPFVMPSLASATWVPLVTSDMFTGAQTDVLTAVASILTIWVILWAASVLMGKL